MHGLSLTPLGPLIAKLKNNDVTSDVVEGDRVVELHDCGRSLILTRDEVHDRANVSFFSTEPFGLHFISAA